MSRHVPRCPYLSTSLSTTAILESLKGHKRDTQTDMFDLFGDAEHSATDQIMRADENRDQWVNRMDRGAIRLGC